MYKSDFAGAPYVVRPARGLTWLEKARRAGGAPVLFEGGFGILILDIFRYYHGLGTPNEGKFKEI